MAQSSRIESFPPTSNLPSKFVPPEQTQSPGESSATRKRGDSTASRISNRVRRLSKTFEESDPPEGFFAATADIASSVYAAAGRSAGARSSVASSERRFSQPGRSETPGSPTIPEDDGGDRNGFFSLAEQSPAKTRVSPSDADPALATSASSESQNTAKHVASVDDATAKATTSVPEGSDADLFMPFDNGYHFPPKYSTQDSFKHAMLAFWHYVKTPVGFLVVLYALNVVAWGGMLFLLLCNASPAMCYPDCEDINSPRRVWIEYDSQILTALFCVTGFGLAPWRFRDMYYLLKYRIFGKYIGLRRLAGIHRGWFRLPGSQDLPIDVGPGNIPDSVSRDEIPFPESKIADAPLTGMRAPPTRLWMVDFILWMNIGNTFLQCVLSGIMWGMNRYNRPSWATGLFVALGMIAAAVGGIGMFHEGKNVKRIEGVPLSDEDREKLASDRARGIYHYNNIKGKRPKEKAEDIEANAEKKSRSKWAGFGRNKAEA